MTTTLKTAGSDHRTAEEQADWERQVDAMNPHRNARGQVVVTGAMPRQQTGQSVIAALLEGLDRIHAKEGRS